MQKFDNLYIPGLKADGTPRCLVEIAGYWEKQLSDARRGGKGDAYLPELAGHLIDRQGHAEIVMIDEVDLRTGEVLSRTIGHNVVTDNGAQNALKVFTAGAPALGQYLILDTKAATSQLSAAISAAVDLTTLNTNNGPGILSTGTSTPGNTAAVSGSKAGSYISNTTGTPCTSGSVGATDATTGGGIAIGFGLAGVEYFSGSATQSNAGNIKASAGVVHGAHAINEWCISQPQTGDGPASALSASAVIYNSVASTNGATGTSAPATVSGTGIGSRQAQYIYTFNSASTAAAYNELWIATASTVATNSAATNYLTHVAFDPKQLNGSTGIAITYTIKI